MRAASFALCVVRYKNKIKSITWQTTPHLCGNLLFLDCVCSRRRQSQRSRCKVKCIIFPFGGEFDPFLKGHAERALLALCLNSQLSTQPLPLSLSLSLFVPFSLPLPAAVPARPCRVAIYEDLCGRCGLFGMEVCHCHIKRKGIWGCGFAPASHAQPVSRASALVLICLE